jgi:hypothetical protein
MRTPPGLRIFQLLSATAIVFCLPTKASAAPCTNGTFDQLTGTSCSIGNVLFNFGTLTVNSNGPSGLSASTITFSIDSIDSSRPGFSLTGNFAATSQIASEQALSFNISVSPLAGAQITNMDMNLANVSLVSPTYAAVAADVELCVSSCSAIHLASHRVNGVLIDDHVSGTAALPPSTSGAYQGSLFLTTQVQGTSSSASVGSWNFHVRTSGMSVGERVTCPILEDGKTAICSVDDTFLPASGTVTYLNERLWAFENNDRSGVVLFTSAGPTGLQITMPAGVAGRGISSICSATGDFDVRVDYNLISWPQLTEPKF